MAMYVAFLRAINLGATRKFPKADIRRVVESIGFIAVETYINTGNVRFTTAMRSVPRIESALEAAFLADRGFDVPTVVLRPTELARIAADAAAIAKTHDAGRRHYVDLLRTPLSADVAGRVESATDDSVTVVVRGRAVHTLVAPEAHTGAGPYRRERLLGVSTNRNATVIRAIADRWC